MLNRKVVYIYVLFPDILTCGNNSLTMLNMGLLNFRSSFLCSQVVNDSLNPVWNQTFDFVVEDGLHDMLILKVWDHDKFGKVKITCCFYQLVFHLSLI